MRPLCFRVAVGQQTRVGEARTYLYLQAAISLVEFMVFRVVVPAPALPKYHVEGTNNVRFTGVVFTDNDEWPRFGQIDDKRAFDRSIIRYLN
jgi:hypothetical protein